MTVTTTSSKVVCLGNGSTTVFAFPFLIPVSGQEQIIYTDTSGVQTTLVASQYTITGFGNPAGGTVTYPKIGAPIPSGATLTIARVLPLTQPTSISNQGAFYPSVVESSLDNATMQIQQIAQGQAQSLKGPIVDSVALGTLPAAAQRANQLLGFDSTGQPIAAQPSSAPISSAMQPVVNAATIAAAVGLLGIPVFVGAGTTTGSANAQVIAATTPSTFTLTAGFRVAAIPGFTNNSAMTLAVAGTGTKNVMKRSATGPVALIGGEVVANQLANWTFDGTQFILEEQSILTNPTLYLKNSASPTPTVTGDIQWDTTNKEIVVGDGSTQRHFSATNPAWGSFKNLKVQVASDTTVTVTADELILEDASGRTYRARSVNVTDTITNSGANGIDTGTATASNWYSVWVIYNQTTNTVASLVSLSATAPTMPSGYAYMMRVGWVRYDATPKLWRTLQYGRRVQIVVGTNPTSFPVIASGTAGALTAAAVTNFVPTATASSIRLTATINSFSSQPDLVISSNSLAVGSQIEFGNSNANGITLRASGEIILESTNIYWSSVKSTTISAIGWEDNL